MIRLKSEDMKHFVTCGEMKLLERRADENGLSYYQMMENAGTQAAKLIRAYCELADVKLEEQEGVEPAKNAVAGSADVKSSTSSLPGADRSTGEREIIDLGRGAAAAVEEHRVKIAEKTGETVTYDIGGTREETGEAGAYNITGLSEAADTVAASILEGLLDTTQTPLYAMIFCGNGNNGGDGFVVARLLAKAGYRVTVVLVNGEPKTEDATTNFKLLEELPVIIVSMAETEDGMLEQKEVPDLFVDAMFGTGFHGSMRGNGLKAAMYINSCREKHGSKVFALDIPSGLGGDQLRDTQIPSQTIHADCTITFHARKPIHLQKFAAAYCGKILVADIGIDEEKLMTVEI